MSKSLLTEKSGDISLVLCGQAGQGIQTVEFLLTRIFKLAGFNVFATKEYMSRVRGGMNSTSIRISSSPVCASVRKIDLLVALNKGAIKHVEERISSQTVILGDGSTIGNEPEKGQCKFIDVPFVKKATEIGDKIYSNVVAVGVIAGLFKIESELVDKYITQYFAVKSDDIIEKNLQASQAGYILGVKLSQSFKINLNQDPKIQQQFLLSGTEAVGLGAIAGGCNFISAYPMSPSTGVLAFFAKQSDNFAIIAEQAEDEIAAINMALGAWYSGARAMVTTSGGGFALMTEGLSLAGMLESPIVIHHAQRPGPATGLPTRTEQADLELALYAGHGEFPRIILAPGTIEDGFYLTERAFNLAGKYQVPVFILSDQYFVDSYYNIDSFDFSGANIEKHFIKTDAAYKRYALTENGISPRGIPGFGKGLVAVDSDEHDQSGHITEDLKLRTKMVDKRLKKTELIENEIIAPQLTGPENYKTLVLCWGSTYHIVKEALKTIAKNDISLLHFKQVYPLHGQTIDYLKKAEKIVIVENNASAQFARLIKLKTGVEIKNRILKYNGLSFTVEELSEKLQEFFQLGPGK